MEVTETAVNVLAGLDEGELTQLASVCRESSFAAGEKVFAEGDSGDELFIVRSGRVRIAKAISLDVDRTLSVLGSGGAFGELAMVGEGSRSASAVALEPTVVLALSKEGFATLTEQAPVLGLKVMGRFAAMLGERLRVTTDLLRDTVSWGLEVSGAAALDLHRVIHTRARVSVALVNGERLTGELLKVERAEAGTLLTISGLEDELHLVPYHAVVQLRVSKALLAAEE